MGNWSNGRLVKTQTFKKDKKMQQRIVTVENAHVKSALIQVNQLTIGGTQKMTLKLFKQITEENIIDFYKGSLKGNPWGFVNYYWPENYNYKNTHLHLLWQKGNELRRCFIDPKGYTDNYGKYIIGHEDSLITLFANTNFSSPMYYLNIKLIQKELNDLIKITGGSSPNFEVVPLKDFHEKMKLFIQEWNNYKSWSSYVYIPEYKKYMYIREYFWLLIEKNFPETEVSKKDMNKVALNIIQPAYNIYMNNYVKACNRLIKDIISSTEQVFI